MARCLVVGGNGFIGSHLSERLLREGYEVAVLDRFKSGVNNLWEISGQIEIFRGSYLDQELLRTAMEGMDYVFHYASSTTPATSIADPVYEIESNLLGSVRLLQIARDEGVKKVIFPSSGGTIYGEPKRLPVREEDCALPSNPYAISKWAVERYLHHFHELYGLDYLILRYSNPYGERQSPYGKQGVIPIFLNRIKHNQRPVIYGDGSMVRDYIYINDIIEATSILFERVIKDKVFNVGSGIGVSLNEIIKTMYSILGEEIRPIYEINSSRTYVTSIVLDIAKIETKTGWKPSTSIEEGIRKTWIWIKRL
ncbi:NAD-dependent epimerase/dehydratase family protein [Methanothrix soehngenii]|jgi:UDP-glucose 4-epimerase|uniref:NAD-dependent epimerase/dehydratase family protein n=1 Tax=Methanothrix soehngenii TaxID=2223 RepID=UPI0023565317|nr:NAD-dependent epimerase/dehydratase family protein [Methanothrix soehngenii]